jgi:acetyl esterase/lipase
VKEFEGQPTEKVFVSKKKKKKDDGTLRLGQIYSPSITVFHAPPSDKPTPAVLISPGGGYMILAIDKTGTDMAKWCSSIGVTGIVLKYSVPNKKTEALQDIQRAMGVIRQNAKEWNIHPDQIGAMGFSAGAHLTTQLIQHHAERTYPEVDAADKLSCKPNYCMLMIPAWLDATTVTPDMPPIFITQNKDDGYFKTTPAYIEALKEKKVSHEAHLFDKGGHNCPLPPSPLAIAAWTGLFEAWLQKTLPTL